MLEGISLMGIYVHSHFGLSRPSVSLALLCSRCTWLKADSEDLARKSLKAALAVVIGPTSRVIGLPAPDSSSQLAKQSL